MKSLDSAQICELTFLLGFDVYLANDDLTLVSINGQKENVSINIDKTSTEALHNHLHFDNFFGANVSVSARSEFIKIVMGGLKLRLKDFFPGRDFRLYAEIDHRDLILRFTQVHPHEENWANESDYQEKIRDGTFYVM